MTKSDQKREESEPPMSGPPTSMPPAAAPPNVGAGADEKASEAAAKAPSRTKSRTRVLAGKYLIQKELARGAMGRVFLAEQITLKRQVAVKVLQPKFTNADFEQRFILEARSVAALQHPNIVTIHDYGKTKLNLLYCVMEYLDGPTLSGLLRTDGRLPLGRAAHIALQVAKALRAAHNQNLIHRDLKPGNIMLLKDDEGADLAKVLDFGLAKVFASAAENEAQEDANAEEPLTREGLMLGTPRYMAPEQIVGKEIVFATDIYALGAVLYQMLSGVPPFEGDTEIDILQNQLKERPVPLVTRRGCENLPPDLLALIERCLAKDPAVRPQTAQEFMDSLREVVSASISNPNYQALFIGEKMNVNASLLAQDAIKKIGSSTGSKPTLQESDFDSAPSRPTPPIVDSLDGLPESFVGVSPVQLPPADDEADAAFAGLADAPSEQPDSGTGDQPLGASATFGGRETPDPAPQEPSVAPEPAVPEATAPEQAVPEATASEATVPASAHTPSLSPAAAEPKAVVPAEPYAYATAPPKRRSPLVAAILALLLVPIFGALWWFFGSGANTIDVTSTPSGMEVVSAQGKKLGKTPLEIDAKKVPAVRVMQGDVASKLLPLPDDESVFHIDASTVFKKAPAEPNKRPAPDDEPANDQPKVATRDAEENAGAKATQTNGAEKTASAAPSPKAKPKRRATRSRSRRRSSVASTPTTRAPEKASESPDEETAPNLPTVDDAKPSVGLVDNKPSVGLVDNKPTVGLIDEASAIGLVDEEKPSVGTLD